MAATYLHLGIPITNKRPNMNYHEGLKTWLTDPTTNDLNIEYLKYEEGTPFPEIMHKNPHVAFKVDDFKPYFDSADSIIFEPYELSPGVRIAFIIKDNTIIELFHYA